MQIVTCSVLACSPYMRLRYMQSSHALPRYMQSAHAPPCTQVAGVYEYDAIAAAGLLACLVSPHLPLPAQFGSRVWELKQNISFRGLSGATVTPTLSRLPDELSKRTWSDKATRHSRPPVTHVLCAYASPVPVSSTYRSSCCLFRPRLYALVRSLPST